MAGNRAVPNHNPDMSLEEEAELNLHDREDDGVDAERNYNSRESGNRLVATYDSKKAVESFSPE
eukprot:scaffold119202_cov15-Prasinocladus_malaysianus.AAC.1